jgi:hypothetical protein
VSRDPRIGSLILRGYLNLAFYIAIVVVLLMPTVFYPGTRGIRIALVVCGVSGIVLVAIERRLRHQWTSLFASGCLAWSGASIGIAYFMSSSDAIGQTVMQLLIVFSLAVVFIGLPWIIERGRTHIR